MDVSIPNGGGRSMKSQVNSVYSGRQIIASVDSPRSDDTSGGGGGGGGEWVDKGTNQRRAVIPRANHEPQSRTNNDH